MSCRLRYRIVPAAATQIKIGTADDEDADYRPFEESARGGFVTPAAVLPEITYWRYPRDSGYALVIEPGGRRSAACFHISNPHESQIRPSSTPRPQRGEPLFRA
jgi:hypothetical protein